MGTEDSFKRSPHLSRKHSTYFAVYDLLFERFRGRPITFVEIGVLQGGSLFMWRDYLGPQARIIGIDLNPVAEKWRDEGFEIFIGNQSDPAFWKSFFDEVGDVDVVLDDGGHLFKQQIVTYANALPHVRDDGLLVFEDTHTSYMEAFGGPSPVSFVSFAKNVVDGIMHRSNKVSDDLPTEKDVFSVAFFDSIVAFHVNRLLARMDSKPVVNEAARAPTRDFRDMDDMVLDDADLAKFFRY